MREELRRAIAGDGEGSCENHADAGKTGAVRSGAGAGGRGVVAPLVAAGICGCCMQQRCGRSGQAAQGEQGNDQQEGSNYAKARFFHRITLIALSPPCQAGKRCPRCSGSCRGGSPEAAEEERAEGAQEEKSGRCRGRKEREVRRKKRAGSAEVLRVNTRFAPTESNSVGANLVFAQNRIQVGANLVFAHQLSASRTW